MRDGARSQEKLLRAATEEFATYGVAGARVDRIATSAGVNKAQMYAWFGSKEGLFEAVFARHLDRIVDAVPFTADDLPGYAVALYDSYLADPELVRLAAWNRLERVPGGPLLHDDAARAGAKYAAIGDAQERGRIVAGVRPDEVYALVIALAGTWSPISATFTASPDDDPDDHVRRRAALRATVARALVP